MEEIFRFAIENFATEFDAIYKAVDEFPLTLFCLCLDGSQKSQNFRQGIQKLIFFSLIGRDNSQRHFFLYRLVYFQIFDCLIVVKRDYFRNVTRDVLIKSITQRFKTNNYAFRQDLLLYIIALQCQTTLSLGLTKGQGLAKFALVFFEARRQKEAKQLEMRIIETRKRMLSEKHSNTLTSIVNLAAIYRNQGRQKETKELEI